MESTCSVIEEQSIDLDGCNVCHTGNEKSELIQNVHVDSVINCDNTKLFDDCNEQIEDDNDMNNQCKASKGNKRKRRPNMALRRKVDRGNQRKKYVEDKKKKDEFIQHVKTDCQ